jgi:hypothetical protein
MFRRLVSAIASGEHAAVPSGSTRTPEQPAIRQAPVMAARIFDEPPLPTPRTRRRDWGFTASFMTLPFRIFQALSFSTTSPVLHGRATVAGRHSGTPQWR